MVTTDPKLISLGSWAVLIGPYETKQVDFETLCGKLQQFGFDEIEVGGFMGHPNPGRPAGVKDDGNPWPGAILDSQVRKDYAARIREQFGLGLSGLAANLWDQKLVNTNDPGNYLAEFRKNVEFNRDMGIEGIRVDTVQGPDVVATDKVPYKTAIDRVISAWQECCRIAADHGQYVTHKPEPGFFGNRPKDIVRIFQGVDRPNFGIQYDTSHGECIGVRGQRQTDENGIYLAEGQRQVFPSQVELIRYLRGEGVRINHLHLIDTDGELHDNETSIHKPFGDGVVDFDAVVPLLARESDIRRNAWTIDLCFWDNAYEAIERCKKSIDVLNSRFGTIGYETAFNFS
jgi:sugar phosphate isomerase/epimerase